MNFKQVFKNWESPFITRDQIHKVTGGMIQTRTLQNLDSLGQGIPGKVRVSHRKVVYPIENCYKLARKKSI